MSQIDLFMEQMRGFTDVEAISNEVAYQFKNLGKAHQDLIKGILNGDKAFNGFSEKLTSLSNNLVSFDKSKFDNIVLTSGLDDGDKELVNRIALSEEWFGVRQKLIRQNGDNVDQLFEEALASKTSNEEQVARITNAIRLSSAMDVVEDATEAAATSVASFGNSLKVAMASNPIGFWLTVASIIASIAVPAFQYFYKSEEEIIEAGDNAISTMEELRATLDKQASSAEELGTKYAKLAQGVNQITGENLTLSSDDYSEYVDLSNQLATIFPELVEGYDGQGNAILTLNGDYEAINATLNEYIDLQRQGLAIAAERNLSTITKGVSERVEEQREEANAVRNSLANYKSLYARWGLGDTVGNGLYDNLSYKSLLDAAGVQAEYRPYDGGLIFDRAEAEQKIAAFFNDLEQQIAAESDDIVGEYAELNKEIITALGDDEIYTALSSTQKTALQRIMNQIDWEGDLGLVESADIMNYVEKTLIGSINNAGSQIEKAFNQQTLFNKNKISVGEYRAEVEALLEVLHDAGSDETTMSIFEDMLSLPDVDIGRVAAKVYTALSGVTSGQNVAGIKDFLNSLTGDELDAFLDWINEVELSSYETWESALVAFEAYKHEILALTASDVLEKFFSGASESIESLNSSVSSLSDAYSKLQNGELKLADVMDLVTEFPELIKYVDLADESFGRLDEGLMHLLRKSPEKLIEELKEFKETSELTDEATEAVDNFIGELEDMPTDAIEGISDEFGIVADSIRDARRELTQLEADLEEPDYDNEYNILQDGYARLVELYEAGQINSKHYKAIAEKLSPELAGMSYEDAGRWIEENATLWGESANVVQELMSRIASMDGPVEALYGLAP